MSWLYLSQVPWRPASSASSGWRCESGRSTTTGKRHDWHSRVLPARPPPRPSASNTPGRWKVTGDRRVQVSQRRDDRWLRSHWFPSGPTGGSTTQGSAFTRGIENGEPYRLYLVTNPTVQASLNLKPFGIRVQPVDFCADHFEFRRADYPVSQLLTLFRLAHARSSNDQQRVMPRWMIVDLVLMPSAVLLAVAGQGGVPPRLFRPAASGRVRRHSYSSRWPLGRRLAVVVTYTRQEAWLQRQAHRPGVLRCRS